MWGKHKKLQDWVSAGLITETQGLTIQAYEDGRKKGKFGRGLVGLAIFSILCGVLSIIGSNWHEITGELKIIAHVLLNAAVGYGAFRAMQKGNNLWREGLSLTFFGLTLTLIALIGQVLQLQGNMANALLLWMVATLPFMLIFSQTLMTAIPWMLVFLATVGFVSAEYLQSVPEKLIVVYVIGIITLLPLALSGGGSLEIMKRLKSVWADVFLKTGAALLAIGASVSPLMLRFNVSREFTDEVIAINNYILLTFAVGYLGVLVHALFHNFYRNDERARGGALFAIVSLTVMMLPFVMLGYVGTVLPAVIFISYWAFIGWTAQNLGFMRIVSLAIFIIAARIFVIYIEIFGSMMDMGIGFIVGGVVMLGLLWGARKLNTRLTKKIEVQA